ncbi:zinc-ribbon domain-containing protein [Myxococcota bacterium]|nr:zinc-ribbon domain-containing protein [Myxococcota bacterium]
MIVSCEKCGKRYQLEESKVGPAGIKLRCTKCNTLFHVPPLSSVKAPAKAPPKPAPMSLDGPNDITVQKAPAKPAALNLDGPSDITTPAPASAPLQASDSLLGDDLFADLPPLDTLSSPSNAPAAPPKDLPPKAPPPKTPEPKVQASISRTPATDGLFAALKSGSLKTQELSETQEAQEVPAPPQTPQKAPTSTPPTQPPAVDSPPPNEGLFAALKNPPPRPPQQPAAPPAQSIGANDPFGFPENSPESPHKPPQSTEEFESSFDLISDDPEPEAKTPVPEAPPLQMQVDDSAPLADPFAGGSNQIAPDNFGDEGLDSLPGLKLDLGGNDSNIPTQDFALNTGANNGLNDIPFHPTGSLSSDGSVQGLDQNNHSAKLDDSAFQAPPAQNQKLELDVEPGLFDHEDDEAKENDKVRQAFAQNEGGSGFSYALGWLSSAIFALAMGLGGLFFLFTQGPVGGPFDWSLEKQDTDTALSQITIKNKRAFILPAANNYSLLVFSADAERNTENLEGQLMAVAEIKNNDGMIIQRIRQPFGMSFTPEELSKIKTSEKLQALIQTKRSKPLPKKSKAQFFMILDAPNETLQNLEHKISVELVPLNPRVPKKRAKKVQEQVEEIEDIQESEKVEEAVEKTKKQRRKAKKRRRKNNRPD